jgi:predicted thioesterase
MKTPPKVGAVGELKFIVEARHAIDFAKEGMPPVLSTPSLIWFLEHAAREAMLPCLEPGDSTVGTEIELQHLAPTPLGHTVVCQARVVRVDGPEVWFQLDAHDDAEPIARGFHKRRFVRAERFQSRLRKKAAHPTGQSSPSH